MKSKVAVLLYLIVCVYIYFNREEYKGLYIRSDQSGYYVYLPAAILYHDVVKMDFYPNINHAYNINPNDDRYGVLDNPNGKRTVKYAIGTSLFELPFFLIAHLYCKFDHRHPDDGYSMPYEVMITISAIFWAAFGLFILRNFLIRHFSDSVTAITILCIGFGTNLYCYTVFIPGFSHPYSFVIFSCVLYFTDLWYATEKRRYLYFLSLSLGLAIITRPINIVVAIVPLLWMIDSFKGVSARIKFYLKSIAPLAIAVLLFLSVSLIQMLYWRATAGSWIYYSYVGEKFNFSDPQIWNGLFSWRKGWFIYTPIALVSMYGFLSLWQINRKMILGPLIFFLLIIYIVFSWTNWWYGSGFSARSLIDVLPVAALPLAAFVKQTFRFKTKF